MNSRHLPFHILLLYCLSQPFLFAVDSFADDATTMAVPILSAPINATWAANHGESWYEKGFRGFVFEGILDDFTPFPAEEAALRLEAIPFDDDNTGYIKTSSHTDIHREDLIPGDWDRLQKEIHGAANRLRAEGITENFLAMKLAPEAPWFTSPLWRRIAESRFDMASRFCRETRLRGIALDSCPDSLFYDYRWEGWPPHLEGDALTEEARRFGRRLALIFTRHCSEGVLLLRAHTPESCGPLWFVFFEGLLEGLESSRGGTLRLLFTGLTDSDKPQEYEIRQEKVERLWGQRFSPRARQGWERKGGLVFSLEPVGWQGDIPIARYPVEDYIPALYGAAFQGKDYVIIDAPSGGWWHIPPDMAEQFSGLYQKGRGRVAFAPPIPRSLDAFQPRLLYEGAQRLGELIVGEMLSTVLHHEGKTILLAWEGIPEEMRWPLNTGVMTVTEVLTGEKKYLGPREGSVTLAPLAAPVFIEGSPLEEYAIPASFGLKITPPLSRGVTRSQMTLRLTNTFNTLLEGMITLSTSSRYAFGSSTQAVHANPGESLSFTRYLQGLSFQGAHAAFVMTFNRPNALPVSRDFFFTVAPQQTGSLFVDAPLTGVPLLLPDEPGYRPNTLLWSDRRGRLMTYGLDSGQILWSRRFRGNYNLSPQLLKNRQGESLIALANDHNRIRLLDREGEERALLLPEGERITGLAVLEREKKGDVLAVLLDDTSLVFYEGGLRLLGRSEEKGQLSHITIHTLLPECLLCMVETKESDKSQYHLACLDSRGETVWSRQIPDAPATAPFIRKHTASEDIEIFVPDHKGKLHVFSGKEGREHRSFSLDGAGQIEAFALLTVDEKEMLLCQSTQGLKAYALEEEETATGLWQEDLAEITAFVAQPEGTGVIVGTAEGTLHAFSAAGDYEWEDRRGTGAISHLSTLPSPTLHSFRLFVASEDSAIRILDVQAVK